MDVTNKIPKLITRALFQRCRSEVVHMIHTVKCLCQYLKMTDWKKGGNAQQLE